MRTAICTISTESHLFKSYALLESVRKYNAADTFCLVTDLKEKPSQDGITFHVKADLSSEIAVHLKNKYKGDKLRWALKSVYVKYLLENGYDKVIYLDNDIFLYDSLEFLFEKLNTSNFLLTPHFYKADPQRDQNWLEANYRVGLYNAGFFAANKNAFPILDWWSKCCLYNVKKAYWRGLFDDQKYLDLIPIQFNNVEIIKHRGCNFAGWNCDNIRLEPHPENHITIDGDPLIFVHFTPLTIERFRHTNSNFYSIIKEYSNALRKYDAEFQFPRDKKLTFQEVSTFFYYLRWKLMRSVEK